MTIRLGAFRGRVLSVGELLEQAKAEPELDWLAFYGDDVSIDAAFEAEHNRPLVDDGWPVWELWRFFIGQSIDRYNFAFKRDGARLGAKVFDREPPPTGSPVIDAAFAGLAEYLAHRDGWEPPAWVEGPGRVVEGRNYVTSERYWSVADQETPVQFARHGVFLTEDHLMRA